MNLVIEELELNIYKIRVGVETIFNAVPLNEIHRYVNYVKERYGITSLNVHSHSDVEKDMIVNAFHEEHYTSKTKGYRYYKEKEFYSNVRLTK